jgi:glycogen debranching enzyme
VKESELPTPLDVRTDGAFKAAAGPPVKPGDALPTPAPAVQFYIPATSSLQERRPRTLKHGDTFGVFDHYGDIAPGEGSPEGIYHCDTRFLSGLQLLIDDRRPLLLSSTVQDNNALLTADLTNPDFFDEAGRLRLPRDTIHIVRAKFMWHGRAHERLAVRNFNDHAHDIRLTLLFQTDFADLFEVRGHQRRARGQTTAEVLSAGTVAFIYHGIAGDVRRTIIHFAPEPAVLDTGRAVFELSLKPMERTSLFLAVVCDGGEPLEARAQQFFVCLRQARRALRTSTSRATAIETSNEIFNEALCRSIADLYMLVTDTAHGPYPYAGIPWFCTAFGRDGIITAMELLWIDPAIAKGVLTFLAATQASEERPEADAEPGKILHETRHGEMAQLGEVPFRQYYGSVDATPLFVMLAGMYYERTGDLDTVRTIWPNVQAALRWIDECGDRDGDGFVEYRTQVERGLDNQGWKDSRDSIFHADGRLAEGPIALCEVQGYVFAAKRHAARLATALGFSHLADTLRGEAATLRERFETAFWCADLATYALALDGAKRPCRVRTSNAGQVLLSGIASPRRAARAAHLLMDPALFSGWGIRTVAESEARYNPMSYHNGSVWPHDNALIALGFARYGLSDHVMRLFRALFEATSYMDLRRLPELFCGFRRVAGKGPTFYPVACSPQAWASAAPFAFLQACLGLSFDLAGERVRFRQPRLPVFLDQVVIRKLRVGDSQFDLVLRRYGADVSVNILDRQGDGRVAITL